MLPYDDERDDEDEVLICICPSECCCQYPEPKDGVALVSEECPIHNDYPWPHPECPIHREMGQREYAHCLLHPVTHTTYVDPNQLELLFPNM